MSLNTLFRVIFLLSLVSFAPVARAAPKPLASGAPPLVQKAIVQSVPEPRGLLLIVFAGAFVILRRHHHRRYIRS